MPKLTVGPWIATQKLPSKALARDRQAFLERTRHRQQAHEVAGLPLVGLGGSCGKPCFALPYTLSWNDANTRELEQIGADFGCFVEYGVYPHLKLLDGEQEVAAVQDWTTFATVYLRPGYERAEELLTELRDRLAPPQTS
ncbi:hypothetical protein [Deinococcus aerophilus]|uniref:Uncharacterized protein n=1 Tax=Deinococcus aerophilus TaxID=522488 RepID=A0ABQ2H1D9_9DEIO|nr:hypothetical protein [Deinococcus aerophilus]GGM21684.1 hypothetical protein GCM10010841_31960 [Deinococcus aerophilus]